MTVRLTDHLTDISVLRRIAPGIDPDHPAETDLERIAFHEMAHGRVLVRHTGGVRWEGQMPPRQLVAEAAQDIMAEPSPEAARARMAILLRRAQARLAAREGDPGGAVEVLARRRAHDGFYALDEVTLRHETFAGGMSGPLDRAVFVSYDAVIMLPYDPASDRVCLVEQFRMGPFARGERDPWMAEPVAGLIDAGETPESTAVREAEEEAGLAIERLVPLGAGYSSPGASTGYHHHFIGICAIPERVRRGGLDAEGEDIRAVPLPAEELFARLDAGRLRNTPLILCAYALRQLREGLRAG